jgi:hypothetical protein
MNITFYIHDAGDKSVGIREVHEEVMVECNANGIIGDDRKRFEQAFVAFLKEYCEVQVVLTEDEEQARIDEERRQEEMLDRMESGEI